MSAPARIGLVAVAVAVAVGLFFLLREDDEAAGPTDTAAVDGTEPAATEATPTETAAPDETTAPETTAPATTEEAPDVVRARIRIGPDGPDGGERIVARQGQRVVLTVESQLRDHVHVHGYDLFADVGPGTPATIRFRAEVPGRFEIELEDRHVPIAQLRVNP